MNFDLLVDAIYEAGVDPTHWHHVLALLTASFRGACAAMHVGDATSDFTFGVTYRLNPEANKAYAQHFFTLNPLNAPLTRVAAGTAVGDNQLVPRETYSKGEFYNDYARPFGLNGSVTAILDNSAGHVSCLGVITETGSDPHSPDEVQLFQRLVPHLRRAVELNRKFAELKAYSEVSGSALDQLDFGVVLVGDNGRVLRANAAAANIFKSNNGFHLVRGALRLIDSASQAQLDYLIGCAINRVGPRGGSLLIVRPNGQQPFFARVLPCLRDDLDEFSNVRALIYLRDPNNASRSEAGYAIMAYGLTPAEGRILQALMKDPSVTKIAQETGISITTARNHIARILQKTGTSKQIELLRLVHKSQLPLLDGKL